MSDSVDNEGYAEALLNIQKGSAAVISDETLPGGRFKVIAHVSRGPELTSFVITEWRQEPMSPDWVSNKVLFLSGEAVLNLMQLLRSAPLA